MPSANHPMPTAPTGHDLLAERFEQLNAFLLRHQTLWRPRPFTEPCLAWEREHPELATWLRQRSLKQAEAAQACPADLPAPAPFTELATQAVALGSLSPLSAPQLAATPAPVDVPGRKWLQIQAFAAALPLAEDEAQHWLDWCAGKGHLGRYLAMHGQQASCLEWDAALVAAGQHLSQKQGVSVRHQQQDVMADGVAEHLHPGVTPVALHACGDLHVRLLEQGISRGCQRLAIAPCCYNRTQARHYRALSQRARRSALALTRDDLGLPLSETVTAGRRECHQRDQSMAWRLGFDRLQRQLRSADAYLPIPSLPAAWLKKPFETYCRDLAQLKALPAPGAQDWAALERHGWQRLAQVRNLELVRALFRRPLELWLVLDQALLLAENGYRVRLGTFCHHDLTPRNIMLLAERHCAIAGT